MAENAGCLQKLRDLIDNKKFASPTNAQALWEKKLKCNRTKFRDGPPQRLLKPITARLEHIEPLLMQKHKDYPDRGAQSAYIFRKMDGSHVNAFLKWQDGQWVLVDMRFDSGNQMPLTKDCRAEIVTQILQCLDLAVLNLPSKNGFMILVSLEFYCPKKGFDGLRGHYAPFQQKARTAAEMQALGFCFCLLGMVVVDRTNPSKWKSHASHPCKFEDWFKMCKQEYCVSKYEHNQICQRRLVHTIPMWKVGPDAWETPLIDIFEQAQDNKWEGLCVGLALQDCCKFGNKENVYRMFWKIKNSRQFSATYMAKTATKNENECDVWLWIQDLNYQPRAFEVDDHDRSRSCVLRSMPVDKKNLAQMKAGESVDIWCVMWDMGIDEKVRHVGYLKTKPNPEYGHPQGFAKALFDTLLTLAERDLNISSDTHAEQTGDDGLLTFAEHDSSDEEDNEAGASASTKPKPKFFEEINDDNFHRQKQNTNDKAFEKAILDNNEEEAKDCLKERLRKRLVSKTSRHGKAKHKQDLCMQELRAKYPHGVIEPDEFEAAQEALPDLVARVKGLLETEKQKAKADKEAARLKLKADKDAAKEAKQQATAAKKSEAAAAKATKDAAKPSKANRSRKRAAAAEQTAAPPAAQPGAAPAPPPAAQPGAAQPGAAPPAATPADSRPHKKAAIRADARPHNNAATAAGTAAAAGGGGDQPSEEAETAAVEEGGKQSAEEVAQANNEMQMRRGAERKDGKQVAGGEAKEGEYEAQRDANVASNHNLLVALGIQKAVQDVHQNGRQAKSSQSRSKGKRRADDSEIFRRETRSRTTSTSTADDEEEQEEAGARAAQHEEQEEAGELDLTADDEEEQEEAGARAAQHEEQLETAADDDVLPTLRSAFGATMEQYARQRAIDNRRGPMTPGLSLYRLFQGFIVQTTHYDPVQRIREDIQRDVRRTRCKR